MRLFRHFQNLPSDVRGAAVAIGNFDGVHLGHHAVIGEAGRIARSLNVPWAVLTFEPHPRRVFQRDATPFRLTPFHRKARLIERLGVDVLFVVRFDASFARLSPREFVETVLVSGLGARSVVSGHNFAFGQGRSGKPELLLALGGELGFDYTCVQEVRDDGAEPFSSTRIRTLLQDGDPQGAARVLGRPFVIEGKVIEGDRRGHTLGFPTANVGLDAYARPAFGVYAVCVAVGDDEAAQWRPGVANLGIRPTFRADEPLLETHLFDFEEDIYGQHLRVALIAYLRSEKKFDGLDALKAQIAADGARARGLLASESSLAAGAAINGTGS